MSSFIHKPDYHGGSIVNLMQSIGACFGRPPNQYPALSGFDLPELSSPTNVVLFIIDGLGYRYLKRSAQGGVMNAYLRGSLDSVFPTTTATAITAYLSGVAPQQHGLTGWHMWMESVGDVVAVLPGRTSSGDLIDQAKHRLHVAQPFADSIKADTVAVLPQALTETAYTRAYLEQSDRLGYQDLEGCLSDIEAAIRSRPGPTFVHAYWSELDAKAHTYGVASPAVFAHLMQLEQAFLGLLDRLSGTDTCVVVTADHGFIDTDPTRHLDLQSHPELQKILRHPLCGEPRVAYCYLKPGTEQAFDQYIQDHLSESVLCKPSKTMLEEGWFGLGTPHPDLIQRIGDRVLLMQDNWIVHDSSTSDRPFSMIGVHGGLSAEEQRVPLIVARA